MHIGFDISQTGRGKAGCGYFADAMIGAMMAGAPQNRYSLYPSFGDSFFDYRMPLFNPYPRSGAHYGPRHLTRESARAFWTRPDLDAALGRPDIVHANNFWTPTQPLSGRLVYTLYDIGFVIDPSWNTERNRVRCFDGLFQSSLMADWVVAISRHSRDHYLKVFPYFPADRVRVVYPCSRFDDATAPGTPPAQASHLRPGEFWLSVGTIEPRKNQRMLAHAYSGYLAAGGRPVPLVLAGGSGWLMDDFRNDLAALGIADQVILTGYVTDAEMIWLYRNCTAHLYPSVFEGFGLPVLEGMQLGAATICSNAASLPEVAGDAAIVLPPGDSDQWTASMLTIAASRETRQHYADAGLAQASTFNKQQSASALLAVYRDAMNAPKRQATPPNFSDQTRMTRTAYASG